MKILFFMNTSISDNYQCLNIDSSKVQGFFRKPLPYEKYILLR